MTDSVQLLLGWLWTMVFALLVASILAKIFEKIWAKTQGSDAALSNRTSFSTMLLYAATLAIGLKIVAALTITGDWSWFPNYWRELLSGLWLTLVLLTTSMVIGFSLAVPIGLVQVVGPKPLAWLARIFTTVIRGTPLLVQVWLLYYGLGSLFPGIPWLKASPLWPIFKEGFYTAILALTVSVAGYEGEIMRAAFLGVPKGELEAADAYGMSFLTKVRRIWFPRAFRIVLPTLGGEIISQLKSTPIASTVTVMELYGVANKIKANTLRTYEPLIMVAVVYFVLVYFLNRVMKAIENQVPTKK